MSFSKVEQIVYDLAVPMAEAEGVSIWDVEFLKEGKNQVLRVYIDKEGGASINNEAISMALSEKLDEIDPIPAAYSLEVQTAGLDRRLKRESDFLRYIGHLVDVKLYAAMDGQKEFTAELLAFENGIITLSVDKKTLEVPLEKAASVRLAVIF